MEEQPGRGLASFIRRRRLIIVIAIVLIIALAIILVNLYRRRPPTSIQVSGIIEATQVTLASKVNAGVMRVTVDEGDQVTRGQLLVKLKDAEFRDQVRQAQAALAAAQAMYKEALAGPRPQDIQQARAQVEQADAVVAGARRTLAIAEQNYADVTELKARLDAAQTNYNTSVAAYKRAQEALALIRQGARSEQIQAAQAAVNQAQAQYNQSQTDYTRAQQLYDRGAIPASQLDAARTAVETARARLDQAKAQLADLQAGARPEEIRQAEQTVAQTQAAMEGAQQALANARQQYQDRLQERQQLTTARTQYQTAQAQLAAAQAQLNKLLAGTRPEQIEQAKAGVEQAEAAVAQAETQLENTTIQSPIDGTVITRAVEPGDLATLGSTLLVLADLSKVKLKVYVEEPYMRIRLDQPADVTVDYYPNEVFTGRVTEIAQQAEFTPKEIQTREQRAKLVFAVTITLPNPEGKLKPGMPADAVLALMPLRQAQGRPLQGS